MALFTTSLKWGLVFCLVAGAAEAQAPKAAMTPKPAAAKHTQIGMSMKDKMAFAGTYQLTTGKALTIALVAGQLQAALEGQAGSYIYPESPTQFFYSTIDTQISFVLGKDGKAKSLTLHQGGRAVTGTRTK